MTAFARLLLATLLAAATLVAPVATGVPEPAVAVPPVEPSVVEEPVPLLAGGPAREVEPSSDFAMVGVTWSQYDTGAGPVQVRVRTGDGPWSEWTTLDVAETRTDPGTEEAAGARPGTDLLWVGDADEVQVRAVNARGAGRPRVALIDPGTGAADATIGARRGGVAAQAAPTKPPIVTRAQWGADESLRDCTPSVASGLKAGIVHHTVSSNTYAASDSAAIVRGIYAYHTQSQGWCDIGYNFLVDRFGTVFEGRYGGVDKPVIGAQTGGFNTYTLGISMIGTYTSVQPPAATWASVAAVLAWRFSAAGISPIGTTQLTSAGNSKYAAGTTVTIPTIVGHRDLYATECPGNAAYPQLPALRTQVASLLTATPPATPTPSPTTPATPVPGVKASDFSGDGKADVLARDTTGNLWLYPGTGTSGWQPRTQVGTGWNVMTALLSPGDFSGDGKADVLARDTTGNLWLYPGTGTSGWQPRTQVGTGWNVMTAVAPGTTPLEATATAAVPTAPVQTTPVQTAPVGSVQDITNGRLYTSPAGGTFPVVAGMFARYVALGETASPLGWPTSAEYAVTGGAAQDFGGGRLVWSSTTQEVTTERPASTVSTYIVLSGATATDVATATALGCTHGRSGRPGLYLLAFGTQEPRGLRPPGTTAASQWPRAPYSLVGDVARAYVRGVVDCRPSRAQVMEIGLGVNNKADGGVAGATAGADWASLVGGVASWVTTLGAAASGVSVVGANDMEPGWGTRSWARAWVDGYLAGTAVPLVSFGSADGCPTYGSTSTTCNNGWTVEDVWYVSGGASSRVSVIPQIYRTDGIQASQWARISSWGATNRQRPLTFAGALSQSRACQQRGGCTTTANTPEAAWSQLWQALRAHPETSTPVLYRSSDMAWQG